MTEYAFEGPKRGATVTWSFETQTYAVDGSERDAVPARPSARRSDLRDDGIGFHAPSPA